MVLHEKLCGRVGRRPINSKHQSPGLIPGAFVFLFRLTLVPIQQPFHAVSLLSTVHR